MNWQNQLCGRVRTLLIGVTSPPAEPIHWLDPTEPARSRMVAPADRCRGFGHRHAMGRCASSSNGKTAYRDRLPLPPCPISIMTMIQTGSNKISQNGTRLASPVSPLDTTTKQLPLPAGPGPGSSGAADQAAADQQSQNSPAARPGSSSSTVPEPAGQGLLPFPQQSGQVGADLALLFLVLTQVEQQRNSAPNNRTS